MKIKIAAAQTADESDYKVNLAKAEQYMKEASAQGAKLILFPEGFMAAFPSGTPAEVKLQAAQTMDGPFVTSMCSLAAQYGLWTVFGMSEPCDESHSYNTTVIVNDQGSVAATYHKTHLYDAFRHRESDLTKAGDTLFESVETPFGRIGLMVCYELRFPEIARYEVLKQKADILLIPTMWIKGKRKAEQLRIMTCARALENNVYAVMCDMCGEYSVGGSCIIGPLGEVIEELGEEEGLLVAEYDSEITDKVRSIVPALATRRPELY